MATNGTSGTNGTSSDTGSCFNRGTMMAELDEKGYCVIPDVLTSEECDAHVASYREWFDKFGDEEWRRPSQRHSLIQSYRIGHFKPTWETRLTAKKVFETVWQTKKLLTSFGGVAISPPQDEEYHNQPGNRWLHLDQSARRRGLHCYQGAAYLEESSDTDYCFRVLEGSHKHTDDFYTEDKIETKGDFFHLSDVNITWFEQHGCPMTKVPVPKGGMVLWDSRLVHDNCRPELGRPNADRWRFVVFVCMVPARWASQRDLSEKRRAYELMRMTSHWPAQDINVHEEPIADNFSGVPLLPELPEAARSQDARMLAGVTEYDFEDGEPNGPAWDPDWMPWD